MAKKIREIMSPAPVGLAATDPVSAAARAMKEHGTGTVLVLAGGKLTGLVTDRDITVRVLADNRDPQATPLGDICSSDLAVVGPDDDVDQAAKLIRDRAVRRIPVVRDGTAVGIVSIGDLTPEEDERSAHSAAPPDA